MKLPQKNQISYLIIAFIFLALGLYFADRKFSVKAAKDTVVQQLFSSQLKDVDGNPQKISQWQGQFLLVNFWATWCKPCVQEMPELQALSLAFKSKQLQVVGMGIDSPAQIRAFRDQHHITYPLLVAGLEGTDLGTALGNQVGGLPFTVLISPDGRILKHYVGRLKMDELRRDIAQLNLGT